ncbi:MAG: hypothetical protein PHQ52_06835 [Candidatus Omnitrophica bacterium]|nr:hypothetical protein [Candidatus Omnitrophota bacterium]
MEEFEQIFGIDSKDLKDTCVVMPFINSEMRKSLQIKNLNKGGLYSSVSNDAFTVVLTRMGAGFTGDCICYLAEAGVKNIIFIGSCAGVNPALKIGDVVRVIEGYSVDSFSCILKRDLQKNMYVKLNTISETTIEKTNYAVCLTTASIKHEKNIVENIQCGDIDVIDMESSAVIESANRFGLNAQIFLFIQDIYPDKPFYRAYDAHDKLLISDAQKRIASIIWDTIK